MSARFGASPKKAEGFPHELRDLAILQVRSKGGVVLCEFVGEIPLTNSIQHRNCMPGRLPWLKILSLHAEPRPPNDTECVTSVLGCVKTSRIILS